LKRFLEKGVFPYKWFDSYDKLDYPSLHSKDDLRNDLTNTQIDDEDYERVVWVLNKFECKKLRDYQDIYLESDVLLSGDVFQEFRIQTRKNIDIDPLHYINLPSMAFDGAVKKAKEFCEPSIDLVTDPDMYMMLERGIRGVVSQISNRYGKANNP